jgi:hypothetical protein
MKYELVFQREFGSVQHGPEGVGNSRILPHTPGFVTNDAPAVPAGGVGAVLVRVIQLRLPAFLQLLTN